MFGSTLRKSQAPPTSPLNRRRTVEAGLERHILAKVEDQLPSASRADFETWLHGTIHASLLQGSTLTKKDVKDLELKAQTVVAKLNQTLTGLKLARTAVPKTETVSFAASSKGNQSYEPSSAPRTPPSPAVGGGAGGSKRPLTAPERDSPVAGVPHNERPSSTPSLPSPFRDSGRATKNTLAAAGTITFTSAGAFDGNGKPLPELEYFRKQKRKVATRDGLYGQMAEHQVAEEREKFVKKSYVAAEDEMLSRALAVAARQKEVSQHKVTEDALMVRRQLTEREAQRKAEAAKTLAEEDAHLRLMKTLHEADQARFRALKLKEKEELMAAKRENDVLREIRAQMALEAAEEEKRLQAMRSHKEKAAEDAHRGKYKSIAENQERLAVLLVESTRAHREKMESFYTIQAIEAEKNFIKAEEAEKKRKQARKASVMDSLVVIREQMRVKAEAASEDKAVNRKLGIEGRNEILAAVEARKADKKKAKDKLRSFAKELEVQAAIRGHALSLPPPDKYKFYASETFQGTSLPTATTSSDWDTENLFKRTINPPPVAGNRSDEIAPLLGFGAPFVTKIEQMATIAPVPTPSLVEAVASLKPFAPGEDTYHANLKIVKPPLKPSQALAAAAAAVSSPKK